MTSQLSTTLYQGYRILQAFRLVHRRRGKRTLKWGKGYAWNPAAFLDRPKDPDDPELALEGFWVGSADYIKSFTGPQNVLADAGRFALLPDVNKDFGETGHVNVGAKFYFLFLDTDIDVMALAGGSRTARYGIDFSRNVTPNLEIHGEFALIPDFTKILLDQTATSPEDLQCGELPRSGCSYLTAQGHDLHSRILPEGYRVFAGKEMRDYFSFVDRGYGVRCNGRRRPC